MQPELERRSEAKAPPLTAKMEAKTRAGLLSGMVRMLAELAERETLEAEDGGGALR